VLGTSFSVGKVSLQHYEQFPSSIPTPLYVISQITRFETVRSDLAQAIAKMHVVGNELKDLAGNKIMDSPDTTKEVSVNFAMWRVYELAQSLLEEAQRLEDLEDGPSPPLSECFNNQFAEDEDMGGGAWALDDVNSEEIMDRQMK
jgi:hypothetical protein